MSDTAIYAIVIGIVVIVVVFVLRGQIATLGVKLFGGEVSVTTHKPAGPPEAGAHMTDVKAGDDATVRDETGTVATMTKVKTKGSASVTATRPPEGVSDAKKR